MRVLSRQQLALLKRQLSKMPLSSSKDIFEAAGLQNFSKTTRYRVLKKVGKVRKSLKRAPFSKVHRGKSVGRAKNNMKVVFRS